MTPEAPEARPGNGDISTCLYCGAVLMYLQEGESCGFRIMEEGEVAELPEDVQELLAKASSICAIVRAKMGRE